MATFVQFGAGNIGRSFIGKKFSDAGYRVVLVDVDPLLVQRLNERGSYAVVVKETGKPDVRHVVANVTAVDGTDTELVVRMILDADYAATSVGQRGLPAVLNVLAKGLEAREAANRPPLDVIIAENMRNAAAYCRDILAGLLPQGFPLANRIGLIETSIGKMVPVMPHYALQEDPLQLFAESYDQLIVDENGFLRQIPSLEGLSPVNNIRAYVDRKLFMHNMSHAATAYLGFEQNQEIRFVWEAMELPAVVDLVGEALRQSADALLRTYPLVFSRESLSQHSEDLMHRYRNRALGDTIFRVGRDLRRKLSRSDRLIGTCLLAARSSLPFSAIAKATSAAFRFSACDDRGVPDHRDMVFLEELGDLGTFGALSQATGLHQTDAVELGVLSTLQSYVGRRVNSDYPHELKSTSD